MTDQINEQQNVYVVAVKVMTVTKVRLYDTSQENAENYVQQLFADSGFEDLCVLDVVDSVEFETVEVLPDDID